MQSKYWTYRTITLICAWKEVYKKYPVGSNYAIKMHFIESLQKLRPSVYIDNGTGKGLTHQDRLKTISMACPLVEWIILFIILKKKQRYFEKKCNKNLNHRRKNLGWTLFILLNSYFIILCFWLLNFVSCIKTHVRIFYLFLKIGLLENIHRRESNYKAEEDISVRLS